MDDWQEKKINELFILETGTTPSTKEKNFWENGRRIWITPTDLSKVGSKIFIFDSERKITDSALRKCNLTELPIDSLILSTRAPVGYVAIVKSPASFNQGCKGLIPKSDSKIDIAFYYYYLISIKHYLQSISGGSTFKELSKDLLSSLDVPYPEFKEQKAIAQILSTVDEAIQKADEAIKHTERLKQGLMQKLLTEGIGHTEFKETKIGRIPKEWEVQPIGNLGKVITGKTPSTLRKEYWNGDIPFITPGDIVNSKYVYTTERRVTKEGVSTITQILPPNSLLVVCIGSTIGKVGLTFTECITNQQINSIILDRRHYDASYIYYAFLKISKKFKAYSGTAAVPIIKKSLFEKYLLPVPSFHEQKRIGEILSIVDKKAEIERKRKVRFENIKKGLMNDLLTGKKRVKV